MNAPGRSLLDGGEVPEGEKLMERREQATTPPLRVCFVALHALPAIDPSLGRPVGGTETRAWTFARGLARSGQCDVRFVVRADSRHEPFQRENVDVIPRVDRLYALYESAGRCLEKSSRWPGLQLRHWEWSLLGTLPALAACRLFARGRRDPWRADPFLVRQTADLFCTFGVQANSARVIASAHATGRKAILMIGSDGDLDERYQPDSGYVSPYGDAAEVCYEILQRADAIVVQTPLQHRLVEERFGRESTIIANPIDLDAWDQRRALPLSQEITGGLRRYALWVGRAESLHKRPDLLLEVARMSPDVDFLMILNPRDRVVEKAVRDHCPKNVRIVSSVPFDLMPVVFEHAAVFVSTSALEGFPNVFLQAAATGVPVASLEVGGDFIQASQCGLCAEGDTNRLAEYVKSVWCQSGGPGKLSGPDGSAGSHDPDRPTGGGRAFVAAEHDLPMQTARLLAMLKSVITTENQDA